MAAAQRRELGGIAQLIDLIDENRGAVEYDLRARLNVSLDELGSTLRWAEALRLVQRLAADPSTQIAAALWGWEHPLSREAIILADLFDLTVQAAGGKRAKSYPRPWPESKETRQLKPAEHVTQLDVHAALSRAGHEMRPPV